VLKLDAELANRLRELRVRVDVPDANTVFFRNVPTDPRFFNKPRTNLLLKRPQEGLPFVVCVDEDLEYTGDDEAVVRTFQSAHRRQGWRVLFAGNEARADVQQVVGDALGLLGVAAGEPALPRPRQVRGGGLVAAFGADLTRQVREGAAQLTLGRSEEIERVVACLLQWQARMPLVSGPSGVGKTNLLHGVARKLNEYRPALRVVAVDLGAVMAGVLFDAERENLLAGLLKEAAGAPDTVMALEHVELTATSLPCGPLLLGRALDEGVRLAGTTLPEFVGKLEVSPLARRLHVVDLPEPGPGEAGEVTQALRERISAHHGVAIDDEMVRVVVERSLSLAGHLPAKAVTLLDAAAAGAALAGSSQVELYHLYSAAAHFRQAD